MPHIKLNSLLLLLWLLLNVEHLSYQQEILCGNPHSIWKSIIIFILHKLLWICSPNFYLEQKGDKKDTVNTKFRRTSVEDSFSVPSNLTFAKTTFRISLSFSVADFSHILSEKPLKRGGLLRTAFTLLYCSSFEIRIWQTNDWPGINATWLYL